MNHLFSLNASMSRWPLVVALLCLASPVQLYAKEPPIDEKAVRALLEAKDLKSLDRLAAMSDQGDEALRAVYRARRLVFNKTGEEELRFLEALPDSEAKLRRVYQLTYSGLAEDPRIADVVYGMFERAARLVQKHSQGHRRILRLCLFSDGELAETAWEWCDWLVKTDPQRTLNAVRLLPAEDQRRICGDVKLQRLTAKEFAEKCTSEQ